MALWHWCAQKNVVREGERGRTTDILAYMITAQAAEFEKLTEKEKGMKEQRRMKWQRSEEGWVKINTDGAFDAMTNQALAS
uniref:RNase H type-1 domain-containing protein n=1 Tax=Leersia perrieri TaxID=77586 RepID=A0A0D9WG00_9ORYZ